MIEIVVPIPPRLLAAAWWLVLAVAISQAADRPNIVLIMADDLGYETLGCYGGTSYRTPRIDRLAREGMLFRQAYATPLCTNTRVQLMTGKYAHRNWVAFGILDPGQRTVGHYLQAAGYRTCMAGKWQLYSYDPPDYPGAAARRGIGMPPEKAGFDEYCLWHTGHTEVKGSRYADPVIDQNGTLRSDTAGQYGPDIWADFVCDFIDRHQQQPFFVYYAMALPHNPFVPTPDSRQWQTPALRHQEDTRFAGDMIEYTDKLVGRIVDRIDALGLDRQTLILFFSDNGTNQRVVSRVGETIVRGGKGTATDLGMRVPLVARCTGLISPHTTSDDLVDSTDFLPTLCQAAGGSVDRLHDVDGRSFLPQLTGQRGDPRAWVFLHQDPRPGWDKDRFHLIRLARTQRYKLYEDGRLFDMPADPREQRPVMPGHDSRTSRAARQQLQQVLDAMKPFGLFDPAEVPGGDPWQTTPGNAFQEQDGCVVMEAETPLRPRDESWRAESAIPGYTGIGYLRGLRDQPDKVSRGSVAYPVKVLTAGSWFLSLRYRHDHPNAWRENDLWLRVDDGPWIAYPFAGTQRATSVGQWKWTPAVKRPAERPAHSTDQDERLAFDLTEGRHTVHIAPRSANLKIDRLTLYQADRRQQAHNAATPQSPYHPW